MKHIKKFNEGYEEVVPARKLSDKFMKIGVGLASVIKNSDSLSHIVDFAKIVDRYTYSGNATPEFLEFIEEVVRTFPNIKELKSVEILKPGLKIPFYGRTSGVNAGGQYVSMMMYLCSLLKDDGSHKNFE